MPRRFTIGLHELLDIVVAAGPETETARMLGRTLRWVLDDEIDAYILAIGNEAVREPLTAWRDRCSPIPTPTE